MADVLTRCARTGSVIPTGITTDMVQFDSLPDVAIPISCPICGTTHVWKPSTSWIAEKDRFHPGYRNGQRCLARAAVGSRPTRVRFGDVTGAQTALVGSSRFEQIIHGLSQSKRAVAA